MDGTTTDPLAKVLALHGRSASAARPNPRGAPSLPPALSDAELLHRVAMTLNSTLELRDVLHRLATLAVESTGANRCSLFLMDGTRLRPAVALGSDVDEDLWDAFQQMGPVDLRRIPNGMDLVRGLRPVAVEDAAISKLIPSPWARRFRLESLVVVPLHAASRPSGLMVLDYPKRSFNDDELRVLESLGAYAGLAVQNARVFESAQRRARIQEALARGGRELTAATEQSKVVEVLVEAYTSVLGAAGCCIGLFDHRRKRITTVASSAFPAQEGPLTPLPFSDVPVAVMQRLTDAWDEHVGPVTFGAEPWFGTLIGAGFHHHLVLPLTVQAEVRGAVILGFDDGRTLDDEEIAGSRTLAAMGSAVLERSSLAQRLEANVRRLEVLSGVSASLVNGANAPELVRRLGALLGGHGIQVVALSLRDAGLARAIEAESPLPEESGDAATDHAAVVIGDVLSVPLLLNERTVGTLRVKPASLGDEEVRFLETIGRGVAEVVTRGALGAAVHDLALKQAAATVRDVMVGDLHDSIAQYFVAIGLLVRSDCERLPADSRLAKNLQKVARLADGGKWEVDQAVRALAYVPGGGRTLGAALVDLATSFHDDSGIRVLVDADPVAEDLSDDVTRVLYRVAHEALVNAWRHGRCTTVRVSLTFTGTGIELQVRDDGVGFGRHSGDRISGVGLTMLRRLLRAVEGELRVGNVQPQGALLVATVPRPTA